jgi:hypothetical protein
MIPPHLKIAIKRMRQLEKTDKLSERELYQKHDLGLMEEPVKRPSPTAFQLWLGEIERLWGSTHLPE